MKRYKRTLSALLAGVMLFSVMPIERAAAATTHEMTGTVINVQDYGADPTGAKDSTKAVEQAIEAAKKLPANEAKTILFPTGEYHFYEETAPERELYVSNTVGIKPEHKMKRIGILLENMQNVTVDGGDSMFMYHGDITAFAAIGCTNVIFRNFDIDHASPSVVDLTIESVIENENAVTVYVPDCYTYEIRNGNEIHWMGEKGIVSGKPYWEGDNALQYCQIYDAKSGRC